MKLLETSGKVLVIFPKILHRACADLCEVFGHNIIRTENNGMVFADRNTTVTQITTLYSSGAQKKHYTMFLLKSLVLLF